MQNANWQQWIRINPNEYSRMVIAGMAIFLVLIFLCFIKFSKIRNYITFLFVNDFNETSNRGQTYKNYTIHKGVQNIFTSIENTI